MNGCSGDAGCPSIAETSELVSRGAYSAFEAGWCAGTIQRTTQPASTEAIDEVATMLDAAQIADVLTQQE